MSHREMAVARLRAGLCVLPARTDSKRPALIGWKEFQNRLPNEAEIALWFADAQAMCVVAGAVSRHLEMLDFDAGGTVFAAWADLVQSESPDLFDRLVIERSPSGGRHVVYRCPNGVSASLKLAQRKVVGPSGDPVELYGKTNVPRRVGDQFEVLLTLIETRGEGGLFLCHPTTGYELLQGDLGALPSLTLPERELLLRAAWSLDELPPMVAEDLAPSDPCGRPGDDFNERGDVRALLERHSWVRVRPGENEYWRRPGKDTGWSATLKAGVFYVLSANAAPFEPNRGYSPFGVFARLEHGGDFRAAAAALRSQGFGQAPTQPNTSGVDVSRLMNPPPRRNRLSARRVSTVEREQLDWLWPGRIPLGKLTLLAGDPGLGKSLVTLDIAARVSTGRSWPDCPLLAQPVGEVLLFNSEDGLEDTTAPRLDKARADDIELAVLATVLHELAHILERPRLFQERRDVEPVRLLFESIDMASYVQDPLPETAENESRFHHGDRFIRTALHLCHRQLPGLLGRPAIRPLVVRDLEREVIADDTLLMVYSLPWIVIADMGTLAFVVAGSQ